MKRIVFKVILFIGTIPFLFALFSGVYAGITKFSGISVNYNYTSLSKEINLKPNTLSSKIKGDSDLKVSEAIDIANVLKMDKQQCLNCFFNLHKV